MDLFKQQAYFGSDCPCCDTEVGCKDKPVIRRRMRARLKRQLRKEIKSYEDSK